MKPAIFNSLLAIFTATIAVNVYAADGSIKDDVELWQLSNPAKMTKAVDSGLSALIFKQLPKDDQRKLGDIKAAMGNDDAQTPSTFQAYDRELFLTSLTRVTAAEHDLNLPSIHSAKTIMAAYNAAKVNDAALPLKLLALTYRSYSRKITKGKKPGETTMTDAFEEAAKAEGFSKKEMKAAEATLKNTVPAFFADKSPTEAPSSPITANADTERK